MTRRSQGWQDALRGQIREAVRTGRWQPLAWLRQAARDILHCAERLLELRAMRWDSASLGPLPALEDIGAAVGAVHNATSLAPGDGSRRLWTCGVCGDVYSPAWAPPTTTCRQWKCRDGHRYRPFKGGRLTQTIYDDSGQAVTLPCDMDAEAGWWQRAIDATRLGVWRPEQAIPPPPTGPPPAMFVFGPPAPQPAVQRPCAPKSANSARGLVTVTPASFGLAPKAQAIPGPKHPWRGQQPADSDPSLEESEDQPDEEEVPPWRRASRSRPRRGEARRALTRARAAAREAGEVLPPRERSRSRRRRRQRGPRRGQGSGPPPNL